MTSRAPDQARRLAAVLPAFVLLVGLVPLATVVTTDSSAAGTCLGSPVTLVGTSGSVLTGTDGPDVIDTNDATLVYALGGADIICANGRSVVDAGDGDDTVDGTSQPRGSVTLGAGADRYQGGPGFDFVRAAQIIDDGSGGPIHDLNVDVIDTGDGDARILSGYILAPNADRITVGDGDAEVSWAGIPGPGGFLHLGRGSHGLTLGFNQHGLPVHDWVIDASGTVETPLADRLVNLSGHLSRVRLVGRLPAGATLTYLGSQGAERVWLDGHGVVSVRTQGGQDRVVLACNRLTAGSSFSAGPGHDSLNITYCQNARIDLDSHRLNSASLRGFERVDVRAATIDLRGNEAANRLTADGCQVRVDGRRGADDIVVRTYPRGLSCDGSRKVDGGAGDDHMVGSLRGDVLVGGDGFDQAYGRGGLDTCRAEVTRRCEKR